MSSKVIDKQAEFEALLVAIDTAERGTSAKLAETLKSLQQISVELFGDPLYGLKKAVLVGFKRRNHTKSQCPGVGGGEKSCISAVLSTLVSRGYVDVVQAVLPLLPLYGSYRDLRLIAIDCLRLENPGADCGLTAENPVSKKICEIFATQMQKDFELIKADPKALPTSAAKYAPTHFRSRGRSQGQKEKAKKLYEKRGGKWVRRSSTTVGNATIVDEEDVELSVEEPVTSAATEAPAVATDAANAETKRAVTFEHSANCVLATLIAKQIFPEIDSSSKLEASYRKFRSAVTNRLAVNSAMLEPILCSKEWGRIDFIKAPKGALLKNSKAIRASSEGPRWEELMKKDARAVPDIDSVINFAVSLVTESIDSALVPMQIKKAIATVKKEYSSLINKILAILKTTHSEEEATEAVATQSKLTEFFQSLCATGVIVDTANCASREMRCALVFCGYLLTVAQGLSAFVVDGAVVEVPLNDDISTEELLKWIELVPAESSSPDAIVNRLEAGCRALLQRPLISTILTKLRGTSGSSSAPAVAKLDMVLLCSDFDKKRGGAAVESLVKQLQIGEGSSSENCLLRTLRVHQVQTLSEVSFQPRKTPLLAGLSPEQVSVDVCFIVDFTGSMGAYMSAVKEHLVKIINNLRDTTNAGRIRVGLVGYRDYQDEGRVVTVPFRPQSETQAVIDAIQSQSASGGGDAPEDLLSGFVAAAEFNWQSNYRVAVVITDAEAHGFTGGSGGDSHPSGRCPDQQAPYPSLLESAKNLADNLHVDMLYCELSDGAKTTDAISKVYASGGFGKIPFENGSGSFYEMILSGISKAVLDTLVPPNVCGIQSANGVTLSSIASSLNASVRESASGLVGDDKPEASTDYERLCHELELDELAPVRHALGLLSPDSLSVRSGLMLLQTGVTASSLVEQGFPEAILNKVIEATCIKAGRV